MPKLKFPHKDFEWSPKLAYAVGLLTTDGNLSKDGRHIDFTSKDKELVDTFRQCLQLNNKIGQKNSGSCSEKKYHRIQFGNIVFYHWLQKIGLTPNKSKTVGGLKVPNKYFIDFLRGHLDGDGNIDTYKDYYNVYKNPKYVYDRIFTRFRSASKRHTEWLRERISEILSIKGHLNEEKRYRSNQTTSMWILKFAKKDSIKLLNSLYYNNDIPCLMRKRIKAEKFI